MNLPLDPDHDKIEWLIHLALEEDLGSGDITTDSIVVEDQVQLAVVTAKEPLVLCGIDIFRSVFTWLDTSSTFPVQEYQDGDTVPQGETIIQVKSGCTSLLKGERTALNILQWLSGIATLTRKYVERARPVVVLDTRKTRPGMRIFEKYAVRCGGGSNHRYGLYDAVLIKDNHIKAAGSISCAVALVRQKWQKSKVVEVETTCLGEVEEALNAGVDIIMLDNMPLEMMRKAVRLIDGRVRIEVSGSVNLDSLDALSASGVDYVSVGALTHSARAVDISMNILPRTKETI